MLRSREQFRGRNWGRSLSCPKSVVSTTGTSARLHDFCLDGFSVTTENPAAPIPIIHCIRTKPDHGQAILVLFGAKS
jgi:hypothetical protein